MTQAEEIARGLSAEERRELCRSAVRRWRWPWAKVMLVRIRLPVASLERLRELKLYELRGEVNRITPLGREVARCLEEKMG